MIRHFDRALFSIFICVLVVCAGCGGSTISTVTGTVTYQGKSLKYGKIFFAPVDPATPPAQGVIQSDGSYTLEVQGDRKAPVAGAYVGEYRVWVTCYEYDQPGWAGNPLKESKSMIPEKYGSAQNSGLTATVVKGKNKFDFSLE